jgi:adenylosuccinate lyase
MFDVLATRYASPEMVVLWSDRTAIEMERAIWVAVLANQRQMGLPVPEAAIARYRSVLETVDLVSIETRERQTRHQTKARIAEFNDLAGYSLIHAGMTSCDVTENVTAWQVIRGLNLLGRRGTAVVERLAGLIGTYRSTPMVGRTHNLPAQPTTLGRRFAVCAQEFAAGLGNLKYLRGIYPIRSVRGAVGTNSDLQALFGARTGDTAALIDNTLGVVTGADTKWVTVGQTLPRGLDATLGAGMVQLGSAPSSLATTIRLMVGQGLATELASDGQVGSSAMPHKTNPRYAERTCGLLTVVRGYASMLSESAGGVWNEGDVSDSCVRRVALPGLFLAADGLLRTFMVALDRFDPDLEAIGRELAVHKAEMYSGQVLAGLLKRGIPRELAYYAVQTGDYEEVGGPGLAQDGPWPIGLSEAQCDSILDWCASVVAGAPGYDPGEML